MSQSYVDLPDDLPVPVDDGAADHLVGMHVPALALLSTGGQSVDLAALPPGRSVIFVYPMTGQPGVALPPGWDAIPGARGCTPQNCAIRDAYDEFAGLGASVYALSTQSSAYQREMAERLHLPYAVLSDVDFKLTDALRLPSFVHDGIRLLKRITLVTKYGRIERVFYPVFPSDRSAAEVLGWLRDRP